MDRMSRLIAKIFGLYTAKEVEMAIEARLPVFGLVQAEKIVRRLNGNGRKLDRDILSAVRVTGNVLGLKDNFDREVVMAKKDTITNAESNRRQALEMRRLAAEHDLRASVADARASELDKLAEVFAA